MAGPIRNRAPLEQELSKLKSKIKTQMIKVAGYEQAIARLGDTIEDKCMSFIKAERQFWQTTLEADEERYETIMGMAHEEFVPEDSHIPVLSIAELSQISSAELEALENATSLRLSLVQLDNNRIGLEQELRNIIQAKERTQTRPIKSMNTMEDDNEIRSFKSIIEGYADKIREHGSLLFSLSQKLWVAVEAANRAAKSDIEVPGIGRWSPLPTPRTVTATPMSTATTATTASDVVTTEPITVSTAQVEVTDMPPGVKAAAKNPQASTVSDVVATVPRSMTTTVKVDKTLLSITLCAPQKQYANVQSVEQTEFAVGDIGWFPILRPSLSESSSDIHTEFGYICAKAYPLIIVEKLEDCMLGLVISTSNGNGLRLKCASVKSRSAPLLAELSQNSTFPDWGQKLYPRRMLHVKRSSEYSPPAGAYVDMLNVIMIPYDTRFQKKGRLMGVNVPILQQMRLSAVLAKSQAAKLGDDPKFRMWFNEWYRKSCKPA
ncbi:hypothetical protein IG631_10876 [Alternaria alternata]|nr:hypothetical protein IG631_10876 [Alternaria alternata]